jgi:hypothetical protein
MSKSNLSPDATYLELNKSGNFQMLFLGLIELLKKKLQRIDVGDSGHYYYICGEIHDRCNHKWNPFGHMWAYIERKQFDFYVVKDLIEDHLGRHLECECEILRDERDMQRRVLGKQFGVDFGEPGKLGVDIV